MGGSSTFGVGVNDNETWPVYLQQKFDQIELGVEVEVINSGIGSANTRSEVNLIKDKNVIWIKNHGIPIKSKKIYLTLDSHEGIFSLEI